MAQEEKTKTKTKAFMSRCNHQISFHANTRCQDKVERAWAAFVGISGGMRQIPEAVQMSLREPTLVRTIVAKKIYTVPAKSVCNIIGGMAGCQVWRWSLGHGGIGRLHSRASDVRLYKSSRLITGHIPHEIVPLGQFNIFQSLHPFSFNDDR